MPVRPPSEPGQPFPRRVLSPRRPGTARARVRSSGGAAAVPRVPAQLVRSRPPGRARRQARAEARDARTSALGARARARWPRTSRASDDVPGCVPRRPRAPPPPGRRPAAAYSPTACGICSTGGPPKSAAAAITSSSMGDAPYSGGVNGALALLAAIAPAAAAAAPAPPPLAVSVGLAAAPSSRAPSSRERRRARPALRRRLPPRRTHPICLLFGAGTSPGEAVFGHARRGRLRAVIPATAAAAATPAAPAAFAVLAVLAVLGRLRTFRRLMGTGGGVFVARTASSSVSAASPSNSSSERLLDETLLVDRASTRRSRLVFAHCAASARASSGLCTSSPFSTTKGCCPAMPGSELTVTVIW